MTFVNPSNHEPLSKKDTMRYRPFGKTGLEVSALSMGCMRLGEDEDSNSATVSRAIELGVNYFETTRYYCGGQCQHRTAPGLKGKLGGIIVSGKDGINPNQTAYLFRREIDRQLDILGVNHFKFFQVGWFSWGMMPHLLKDGGVLDAIRQAQREGLIHHVGFTGHDTPENFIKCIETGLFDSLTIPYNMINRSYEPTIKRAGELGVGVVAMCPVAGGVLGSHSESLRKAVGMDLPNAEMALRFVLANPDVSTACSGMENVAQVEQNVKAVSEFDPATADFAEMCAGLDRLRETLGNKFCTSCRYCMDCPQGVDIPRIMQIHNMWKTWGLHDWAATAVQQIPQESSAGVCNECGGCEAKCPNKLPIREMLKNVQGLE